MSLPALREELEAFDDPPATRDILNQAFKRKTLGAGASRTIISGGNSSGSLKRKSRDGLGSAETGWRPASAALARQRSPSPPSRARKEKQAIELIDHEDRGGDHKAASQDKADTQPPGVQRGRMHHLLAGLVAAEEAAPSQSAMKDGKRRKVSGGASKKQQQSNLQIKGTQKSSRTVSGWKKGGATSRAPQRRPLQPKSLNSIFDSDSSDEPLAAKAVPGEQLFRDQGMMTDSSQEPLARKRAYNSSQEPLPRRATAQSRGSATRATEAPISHVVTGSDDDDEPLADDVPIATTSAIRRNREDDADDEPLADDAPIAATSSIRRRKEIEDSRAIGSSAPRPHSSEHAGGNSSDVPLSVVRPSKQQHETRPVAASSSVKWPSLRDALSIVEEKTKGVDETGTVLVPASSLYAGDESPLLERRRRVVVAGTPSHAGISSPRAAEQHSVERDDENECTSPIPPPKRRIAMRLPDDENESEEHDESASVAEQSAKGRGQQPKNKRKEKRKIRNSPRSRALFQYEADRSTDEDVHGEKDENDEGIGSDLSSDDRDAVGAFEATQAPKGYNQRAIYMRSLL